MSRRGEFDSLLRWYPRAWRERYAQEFVSYLEDTLCGAAPTRRFRASIALAGLRERSHDLGLVGTRRSASDQTRAGSLVVLGSWSLMVVAGSVLVKTAEHFAAAMPPSARSGAQLAYDAIAAAAVIAAAFFVAGALIVVPSFFRFIRSGGWVRVRTHVLRSLFALALTTTGLLALASWAHHLTAHQRNGGDPWYSGIVLTFALIAVATVALWTLSVFDVVRRLELTSRVLRIESTFAQGVAAMVIAISVAAGVWWHQVGEHAPWFLQGSPHGASASPITLPLILVGSAMAVSSLLAMLGVLRIVSAQHRLEAAARAH